MNYNTLLDYISGSGQGIVGPVSMNGISLMINNIYIQIFIVIILIHQHIYIMIVMVQ